MHGERATDALVDDVGAEPVGEFPHELVRLVTRRHRIVSAEGKGQRASLRARLDDDDAPGAGRTHPLHRADPDRARALYHRDVAEAKEAVAHRVERHRGRFHLCGLFVGQARIGLHHTGGGNCDLTVMDQKIVSENGVTWTEPLEVPLGGSVLAMANGVSGLFVVGGKHGGTGRALHLGHDEICRILTQRLRKRPPLLVATPGVGKDCWAAGENCIVRLDTDTVDAESAQSFGIPIAMALDVIGIPWLLTSNKVLRRHSGGVSTEWVVYHERQSDKPQFVAIGFTCNGAHVLDAYGNTTTIVPHDIHLFS